MNYKTLATLCALSLSLTYAKVAAADPLDFVKEHYAERMNGPWFPDHEWLLDVFGTYALTQDGEYNDGFGGGAGLQYFMTRYFGVGAEAFWWNSDNVIHTFSGDEFL